MANWTDSESLVSRAGVNTPIREPLLPLRSRFSGRLLKRFTRPAVARGLGSPTAESLTRLPGTVTELVGWEHSMKNELIVASYKDLPRKRAAERLHEVLHSVGLEEMKDRFFTE